LPGLIAVGIGMSVSVAKAVLEGAFGIKSPFIRTPKFSVEGVKGEWRNKKYRAEVGVIPLIEIAMGVYFTCVNLWALHLGIYGVVPFLFLFQFGYFFTGICSLAQGLKKSRLPDGAYSVLRLTADSRVSPVRRR
jgi:hypothetical protein